MLLLGIRKMRMRRFLPNALPLDFSSISAHVFMIELFTPLCGFLFFLTRLDGGILGTIFSPGFVCVS
jgi:hypothetical protein